jgi:hypothetical protein
MWWLSGTTHQEDGMSVHFQSELQVTGIVLSKGIEDGPSSILGPNPTAGCIVSHCTVVLKQVMEGILLDQPIWKNHMAKLVFLVHGSIQEATATGSIRIRLFIQSPRTW